MHIIHTIYAPPGAMEKIVAFCLSIVYNAISEEIFICKRIPT